MERIKTDECRITLDYEPSASFLTSMYTDGRTNHHQAVPWVEESILSFGNLVKFSVIQFNRVFHYLIAGSLSRATWLYTPLCPSLHPSPSHFCGLWPHYPCPHTLLTSNTAPAHRHATGLAVYPVVIGHATEYITVKLRSNGPAFNEIHPLTDTDS